MFIENECGLNWRKDQVIPKGINVGDQEQMNREEPYFSSWWKHVKKSELDKTKGLCDIVFSLMEWTDS